MKLETLVHAELAQRRPARLLAVGQTAELLAREFVARQPACLLAAAGSRADLALVSNLLDARNKRTALNLIAALRLQAPCVLAVASETGSVLGFTDFLALGFERIFASPDGVLALYRHDIATYKSVPDWLNPKYWAHPERWEP